MVKLIHFMKRKEGMTFEEFKDYYENHHAVLGAKVLHKMVGYRRNYPMESGFANWPEIVPDFDVCTETWFNTREDFEEMMAHSVKPDIRAILGEDELKFADINSVKVFMVEEHVSDMDELRSR